MNYTITTTNERAGIRAYWGCILIDWNDATNLLWDEIRRRGWDEIRRPPVKDNGWTHKTTNQKHAAIMEDVRRGGTIIRDVKGRRLVTIQWEVVAIYAEPGEGGG